MLSVRAVTIDHYMSRPIYSLYDGKAGHLPKQEPVIRIFGPASTGEKTCVHVHGVYPYIYVPYEGGDQPEIDVKRLTIALDRGLYSEDKPNVDKFVHKINIVSGLPVYGYHSSKRQFYKIYFINPFTVKKASQLLMSGAILNQCLQPHESHIPFTQQFMIDYNICGMSFVNVRQVKYRRNLDRPETMSNIEKDKLLPASVRKAATSYWEVDVLAEDILNKQRAVVGMNPGLKSLWKDEMERRRTSGRCSQITPQTSQSRVHVQPTPSDVRYRQQLVKKMEELKLTMIGTLNLTSASSSPRTPYPCEVPENSRVLSTSMCEPGTVPDVPDHHPPVHDQDVINQHLLTQFNQSHPLEEEEGVPEAEQEEVEEAEFEDEVGVDMTQPLDCWWSDGSDTETADSEHPRTGHVRSAEEDELWKNMADRVFQLDGAGDDEACSSDELTHLCPSDSIIDNLMDTNNILSMLDNLEDGGTSWYDWNTLDVDMICDSLQHDGDRGECGGQPPVKTVTLYKEDLVERDVRACEVKKITNYLPQASNSDEEKQIVFKKYLNKLNVKELVNVEFKSLGKEKIVVLEHRTKDGTKYLVKSLFKFILELKETERSYRTVDSRELNKLVRPLEHKYTGNWLSRNKIDNLKEKFISKSLNTLPQHLQPKTETISYEINESLISKDKIVLKLVKQKKMEEETVECVNKVETCVKENIPPPQEQIDPVMFINQVLTTCSKAKDGFPPVSITINIGGGVVNVDGAGDKSSDDDVEVTPRKKRPRREVYKPLNVVVQQSPKRSVTPATTSSTLGDDDVIVSDGESVQVGCKVPCSRSSGRATPTAALGKRRREKKEGKDKSETRKRRARQLMLEKCDGRVATDRGENVGAATELMIPQSDVVDSSDVEEERKDRGSVQSDMEADDEDDGIVSFNETFQIGANISQELTITPRFEPPTSASLNTPVIFQQPFYSDPNDVTKPLVVGSRVLKIESKFAVKSYEPSCSRGLDEIRRDRTKSLFGADVSRCQLLGTVRDQDITPLQRPPTRSQVERWLERKHEKKIEQPEVVPVKMMLPCSPGNNSNSDDSLTMSPLTPVPAGINRKRTSLLHPRLQTVYEDSTTVPGRRVSKDVFESDSQTPEPLEPARKEKRQDSSCQIEGISLENTYGFRLSVDNLQEAKAVAENELVTTMMLELHVQTRGNLNPDPELDPIRALFYTITNDVPADSPVPGHVTGLIVVGEAGMLNIGAVIPERYNVLYVTDEKTLLDQLLSLVHTWDPDIIGGYQIETLSWGYLIQRAFILELNMLTSLSRVVIDSKQGTTVEPMTTNDEDVDVPGYIRELRIPGRIVLDVWRLFRHEIALTSYTFENVSYHLTHERHPFYTFKALSMLWEHRSSVYRYIVADYYLTRVEGTVRLLDQLDHIGRTSELARLFGVQFYEVFSRGSQFRVESMMLRLAKPLDYIPVSPNIQQRARMRAPTTIPLVMEPESKFHTDPVIVLDFQSLYPSMMIAYNYCFSTCLGRVELLARQEPFEFGCTHLQLTPEELNKLVNELTVSPVGVAFVKTNVRRGVLPQMLEEILDTRLMVKKSMKENKHDKLLQKVLHARQLGLKLIANVTYGYTAANFSGRMPCSEVADSVVSKGRETLERAIQLVHDRTEWGARVVYGDTDSLFVMTPGRSRQDAFRIGAEIAEAVTQDNPKPVKLKLEKVYQPCILQTKKRYVGHMYESPDQEKPVYEAKGIETVRRDGCPAISKVLQKSLEILFETKDVSLVKKYVVRQFVKLYQGRVNIQDLIYARQYRGRRGYRPNACVPALQLAKLWTSTDKRAEPRVKERVPYVFVNGPPGLPLIKLVRSPRDLVVDTSLRINSVYYITKALVPPLQRCFSLLGADVMSWYTNMPRQYHRLARTGGNNRTGDKKSTISQYFASVECVVCGAVCTASVCGSCECDVQLLATTLQDKIRRMERVCGNIRQLCESCCGRSDNILCESLDCPVLYRRKQSVNDVSNQVTVLRTIYQTHLL